MPNETKTIYKVQAWDIKDDRLVEINQNLTRTYKDAFKLAQNLDENLKDYFKDIKIITETYELKSREVLEFKEVE